MNVESVLLEIDRLAGGRHADHTISAEMRSDPRTRRVFVAITWLLVVELLLGTVALAVPVMLHIRGSQVRFHRTKASVPNQIRLRHLPST